MATLPLDVCPANPAATQSVAEPANDTFGPWTDDPRAKLLLASCAANPPRGEWVFVEYVTSRDEIWLYRGFRAEALDAIRCEHARRALEHGDRTGNYAAMATVRSRLTVTDAIDEAYAVAGRA